MINNKETTFSATVNLNLDLLNQLIAPVNQNPTLYRAYYIQRRTHKKKRINKKWAKRYGYIVKQIPLGKITSCKCDSQGHIDYECEFIPSVYPSTKYK